MRTRSYGEAWDVLELLLKCGRKADKYFVSILTKSLEASNDKRWVRRGISLVDKFIEQQREDVDEIVFNSLLNVLGQTGDMQKLQQTLNKMNEKTKDALSGYAESSRVVTVVITCDETRACFCRNASP
mgnify:CR=1 FL=1